MNLEEARNNIGAEIELDESTKPYTFISAMDNLECKKSNNPKDGRIYIIDEIRKNGNVVIKDNIYDDIIHPRHLKLKPQNYKIHVPTEDESRKAQELFFELGAVLGNGDKHAVLVPNIIGLAVIDGLINFVFNDIVMKDINARHITLQELRDMVAKKRMKDFDEKQKLVCSPISLEDIAEQVKGMALKSIGEDKTVRVMGLFQDFDPSKEMTWEDAFQALIDGKEVEMLDIHNQWENIKEFYLYEIMEKGNKFRIAPKRIYLHGNYTKEELLKEIGEME